MENACCSISSVCTPFRFEIAAKHLNKYESSVENNYECERARRSRYFIHSEQFSKDYSDANISIMYGAIALCSSKDL